ncbi:LCP family protein [Candidatus Saccharibacteria bacterium]|nr:LCP family protein [Candidatus Saccharibacteria bacterium]
MDKNKSIDGLASRRSKTATSASVTKKTTTKTTTKKPATKKTTVKKVAPKKTVAKKTVTKKPVTQKPATKSSVTKTVKPVTAAKPTPISTTEDFLKPVQAFNFDEQSGQLVAAKEPIKKTPKMKKEKKPVSKKRKIITRIIIGVLSLLLIVGIIFIIWGNDIIAKITGGQGNVFDLLFQDETYVPLKTDENGRTNILAFGTSGYDMEGTEGETVHDGAQLTDSIMVISLNQETGDFAMLSLPRDLKVSSTCTATSKINEVYWCNNMDGDNEKAGAEALMNEVSDILGVDFQYYAHLNWGSLVSIVDILGGINVTLDEDIEDYEYTGAVFQAGVEYTLDGGQALGLARARHGTTGGDFSRGASQQKILIGIKNKVFEKSLSLSDLLGLANTLGDNLRTSFSIDELRTLAHLLSEFDFNNMRQVSLIEPENYMTTGMINGISYVIPAGGASYYTAIQNYVAKMFSNEPLAYEDATVLILNGTETPGLAASEQEKLTTSLYSGADTSDAPAGEYTNEYTLYALTDAKPDSKKFLEDKYSVKAESADMLPATIPTNYDFVLILGGTPTTDEQ